MSSVPDPAVTDWVPIYAGPQPYQSKVLLYNYEAALTAPPSPGAIRFNGATAGALDTIYISKTTRDGRNAIPFLYDMLEGDQLQVFDPTSATQYMRLAIPAAAPGTWITDSGTHWTVYTAGVAGGTLPPVGKPVGLFTYRSAPVRLNEFLAKGDIVSGRSASRVYKTSVGADGTVLTAASVQNGGVTWGPGPPSVGVLLPSSPVHGQQAILVDSTTNPSYQWLFRYNSGSSSAYKWEFIGGTPMRNAVEAAEYITSSTHTDIATVGPLLVIPRTGEYDIDIWAQIGAGTTDSSAWHLAHLNVFFNGVILNPDLPILTNAIGTPVPWSTGYGSGRNILTSGGTLKMMYAHVAQGPGQLIVMKRRLRITPIRVS